MQKVGSGRLTRYNRAEAPSFGRLLNWLFGFRALADAGVRAGDLRRACNLIFDPYCVWAR